MYLIHIECPCKKTKDAKHSIFYKEHVVVNNYKKYQF